MAEDERSRIVKRANEGLQGCQGKRRAVRPETQAHGPPTSGGTYSKRLTAGERCWSIAKAMAVHYGTIARLAV
jgi:hypothetical protein